jgi:hypothetical protein
VLRRLAEEEEERRIAARDAEFAKLRAAQEKMADKQVGAVMAHARAVVVRMPSTLCVLLLFPSAPRF